jgi:DNA-binding beta-propeller fold protein YncE
VSEASGNVVRMIDHRGVISTVAGTGMAGFSGDGGPAVEAMLNAPADLAVDGDGNLYIADYNNHRIRVVDAKGVIRTIAGND